MSFLSRCTVCDSDVLLLVPWSVPFMGSFERIKWNVTHSCYWQGLNLCVTCPLKTSSTSKNNENDILIDLFIIKKSGTWNHAAQNNYLLIFGKVRFVSLKSINFIFVFPPKIILKLSIHHSNHISFYKCVLFNIREKNNMLISILITIVIFNAENFVH